MTKRFCFACAIVWICIGLHGLGAARGPSVSVWLTAADGSSRLAQQAAVSFGPDKGNVPLTIDVDRSQRFQPIDGFGASLTDSAAWLISARMTAAQRDSLMTKLFSPVSGIGLSLVRQPMGASDFALSSYTYDDVASGSDPDLLQFSIAHDETYLIPRLLQAKTLNPALRIVATPWSPPAWMRTGGSLLGASGGSLPSSRYATYADYFAKFAQAYAAKGLPIYAVTVQNEPHYAPAGYPGMYMEAPEQAAFIKVLGPALAASGLSPAPKIFAWDHNWDEPGYPMTVLADPDARPWVAGTAFHCYAGDPSAQSQVEAAYPDKEIHFTECSAGTWSTGFGANLAWDLENLIIGSLRNGSRSVIKWNVALDENHGPQNGGCGNCTGLVTVTQATGAVAYNYDYYALGHASKFVRPGAVRIASTTFGSGSIEDVAFANPDGSRVLVALNAASGARTLKVRENGSAFTYKLPAGAAATFVWP